MIAAWIRLPAIQYGLPAGRTPDAAKTVGVGLSMAKDWTDGRFRLDPGHYQYPPLYASTLAIFYIHPSLRQHPEENARAISSLFILLLTFPVFFLLRRRWGINAAWGGFFLTAFGFVFLKQSLFPRPDALLAFFTLMSAAFLLRNNHLEFKDAGLGGLMMGLAAAAKYTAPIFLLPIFLVRAFCFQEPRGAGKGFKLIVPFAGFSIAGFIAGAPSFLWRWQAFLQRMALEWKIQKEGGFEEAGRSFLSYLTGSNPGGLRDYSLPEVMGWTFTLLVLIAAVWALWEGWKKKDSTLAALAAGFFFSIAFFSFSSSVKALRFILPAIAMGVILISAFAGPAGAWISEKAGKRGIRISKELIVTILFFLALFPSVSRGIHFMVDLKKTDTRMEAAYHLIQHAPPGARVLNFLFGPALPANRYDMVQWSLPEYRIQEKTFQAPSLFDEAMRQKVEFVVWNSFYTNRFMNKTRWAEESPYAREWRVFYDRLTREAELTAEIPSPNPYCPDIQIFRLSARPVN